MPAVMTGQAVENQFDDHIDQEIQDRCRQKDPDLTVASVLGNDLVRPAHDIHNTNDIGYGGPFQKVDLQVFQVRKRNLHGQRSDHMAKALPAAVADGISRLDLILVNGFISAPEGLGNKAGKVTAGRYHIKNSGVPTIDIDPKGFKDLREPEKHNIDLNQPRRSPEKRNKQGNQPVQRILFSHPYPADPCSQDQGDHGRHQKIKQGCRNIFHQHRKAGNK